MATLKANKKIKINGCKNMKVKMKLSFTLPSLISILVLSNVMFSVNVTSITLGNQIKYNVDYNSGDGIVNSATYTYNVKQIGVTKDSVPCFELKLSISNGTPIRKTHVPVMETVTVKVSDEDQWRSEADLQLIHKYVVGTNVPIVGKVYEDVSYQDYSNYSGLPYAVGQNWTYTTFTSLSSWLVQGSYTDWWSVKVVSDSAIVSVGGTNYTCYEVVHTITSTDAYMSPGDGVGSTITEYWITNGILLVPLKVVDRSNYIGQETSVALTLA